MRQEDNLPQRTDDIYIDIESFEKYELTTCVTYELAIRNNHARSLLRKVDYCNKLLTDYPYLEYNTSSIGIAKHKNKSYIDLKDEEFEINLKQLINEKKHQIFSPDITVNLDILIDPNEDLYKHIYGKHHKDYEMNLELGYEDVKFLIDEIEEKLLHDYLIIPDYYYTSYICADEKYNHLVINDKKDILEDKDYPYFLNSENLHKVFNKGFMILQEAAQDNINKYYINHIVPEYKRKIHSKKQILALLDFSLPTVEIKAYIDHIKREYDKDPKMIKSNDELTKNITKKHKYQKINAKKWADEFFIYDYYKHITGKQKGEIKTDIKIALNEYHGMSGKDYLDDKSIDNKLKKMTSLIENLEYKNYIE